MIHRNLTDAERAAVQALRRDGTLTPADRGRVAVLLLADAGWSPPQIGRPLGCHAVTVRTLLKRFAAEGTARVRRGRPGPPPDMARRQTVTAALDRLLGQDRTWTAGQFAQAVAAEDIHLSTRHTRTYLGRMGTRWRRTARTLRHKQDPVRVAETAVRLDDLKKRRQPAAAA